MSPLTPVSELLKYYQNISIKGEDVEKEPHKPAIQKLSLYFYCLKEYNLKSLDGHLDRKLVWFPFMGYLFYKPQSTKPLPSICAPSAVVGPVTHNAHTPR